MKYRNNIKAYREKKGYTIRTLANKVGISPGHLCDIENERKISSIILAHDICVALECDIWEIFNIR